MILITDTNILYSALIKPEGQVANVLKSKSNFQFFAPSYLFEELKEHWAEIEKATSLTKKELKEEYEFYRNRIKVYEKTKIPNKTLLLAEELVSDIDPDDVYFIALHFLTTHKLWTSDNALVRGLTKKGYGKIFVTTAQLKAQLYKKKK